MVSDQNKEEYINFCKEQENIHIFHQPWWLDLVCEGKDWRAVLSRDKVGNINGIMPYLEEQRYGLKLSRMPVLTPFLGPWIQRSKKEKRHARYSDEAKVIGLLIEQLPQILYFSQKFSPSVTNWYPFYLEGYNQTTSYTYILRNIGNKKNVWNGMKNTVRTAIRKSEEIIEIIEGKSVEELFVIQNDVFIRQGLKVPYKKSLLEELYNACIARKCGKIFYARDKEGNICGGLFLVWDNNSAYNLILGAYTGYRSSGVIQHLIWQSITQAAQIVDTYNFEGTMLPHVEPVFRHFGGERTPYFRISKDKNRFTKAIRILLGKGL